VAGLVAPSFVLVDQIVVGEPLHRAALGADVAEFVPGRQQVRILLAELGPEPEP